MALESGRGVLVFNIDGSRSFSASNYDELVDSPPLELGVHEYARFEADGLFELVIWGEGNFKISSIIEDLKKIVLSTRKSLGAYPFELYVYASPNRWNLRCHRTWGSTIINLDRHIFTDREKYIRFLLTATHEFIHTWNVKAYRPIGIADYDYEKRKLFTITLDQRRLYILFASSTSATSRGHNPTRILKNLGEKH